MDVSAHREKRPRAPKRVAQGFTAASLATSIVRVAVVQRRGVGDGDIGIERNSGPEGPGLHGGGRGGRRYWVLKGPVAARGREGGSKDLEARLWAGRPGQLDVVGLVLQIDNRGLILQKLNALFRILQVLIVEIPALFRVEVLVQRNVVIASSYVSDGGSTHNAVERC